MNVVLSPKTIELFGTCDNHELYSQQLDFRQGTNERAKSILLKNLLKIVQDDKTKEALRISLLQDLIEKFKKGTSSVINPYSTPKKPLLFMALGAAVLNAVLDGFIMMSVLLTTFIDVAVAGMAMLWISIGFAIFYGALSIFYLVCADPKSLHAFGIKSSYDLMLCVQEASLIKELTIFINSRKFLEIYSQQLDVQHGAKSMQENISPTDLENLKTTLQNRKADLKKLANLLETQKNGKLFVLMQKIVIGMLALLSVVSGSMTGFFFLVMLVTLFPTIAIPLWGFVLLGVVTGLAALTLYCIKGHSIVKQSIEVAMHVDKESIDALLSEADTDIYPLAPKLYDCVDIHKEKRENRFLRSTHSFFCEQQKPMRRCKSADDINYDEFFDMGGLKT